MVNYYNEVEGNLHAGDIAKSSDINHIQIHIKDALRNLLDDHHEHDSYILGGDENDFIITPAPRFLGRYIDTYSLPEEQYYRKLPIRTYDYRQPIAKTKTSLYSIICKLGNTSSYPVTVWCEIQDLSGIPLRRTSIDIPAQTEAAEFEVVFDLNYYPTAQGLDHDTLMQFDGKQIPPRSVEESFDTGIDHTDEENKDNFSVGVSQLFFVIKALNINEFDVAENGDEYIGISDDDFYVIADEQGIYGANNNDSYVEQNGGSGYIATPYSLYFKDVYATNPTYLCTGGEAIINGEKVKCIDNHVTIAGGHEYGNVMSLIYMDTEGHLHANNSQASNLTSTNLEDYTLEEPLPMAYLLIAKVLTYIDSSLEPLIIQNDDEQVIDPSKRTRPRSHHERIRRLEKQMNYINDIAIPPRIKYTITGTDWIDKDKDGNLTDSSLYYSDKDADGNSNYITTVDVNGNLVVRTTNNEIITGPVTLKDTSTIITTGTIKDTTTSNESKEYTNDIKESDTKAKLAKLANNDISKLNKVSEMTKMSLNTDKGILTLKPKNKETVGGVGTTAKEAKETEFNPWDDYAENRVQKSALTSDKPIEREYTVTSGKNGQHDWASEFPAMTLYLSESYKLTGLNIPIRKFQNCSGIRFYIWKRQGPNNKTNTVWLEKLVYTSKEFSLKNAKIKGKYQYVDDGFTIKFGNKGLTLPKGQYVIIALPTPKSGKGSCFVETYRPKNSRDFCIRYYGAANASHFLLKTRYPEIWYNSAMVTGTKIDYEKSGSLTSGTVTWESGDPITSVQVNIGQIDVPSGCSFTIYGHTGGNWQKIYTTTVKKNSKNSKITTSSDKVTMKGGGMSFKWKIEFTGNGESSPTLKYNSKKGYALQFILTKKATNIGANAGKEYEKNLSLTSIPFDGNNILKEYVGDPYFNLSDDRFSNYEFGRIWADKDENESLLIDISASDKNVTVPTSNKQIPVYSLHYCDLTLDDFSNTSVDYSNYDNNLEIDENNLRFKIDTENSYNDNDIYLFGIDKFIPQTNDIMSFEESETVTNNGVEETIITSHKIMNFTENTNNENNQVLLKATFDTPINLAKYSGIKVGLKVHGSDEDSIRGLGIYFSSTGENDAPSNYVNDPADMEELSDINLLLSQFNTTDNDLVSKYANKVLKIYHDPENDTQAAVPAYYHYVRNYDSETDSIVYTLEQIHNIKSYTIYRLPKLVVDNDNIIYKTFDINQNSINMQNVKEIGIIALMESKEVDNNGDPWFQAPSNNLSIELEQFRSIEEDYYPVFNPENNSTFIPADSQYSGSGVADKYAIYKKGGLHLNDTGSFATSSQDITYLGANTNTKAIKNTNPITVQISIRPETISTHGEMICYFNNEKETKNYKHVGIQIASDCYIPKNALQLNLCSDTDGLNVVDTLNIPTLNYIYYPNDAAYNGTNHVSTIPLSQVFKKIDTLDTTIRSISIVATDKFHSYMKGMFYDETNSKWTRPMINIFVGKIVFYKAETIPIFHKKMRFKFYNTDKDGLTTNNSITEKDISIRKIGVVAEYK